MQTQPLSRWGMMSVWSFQMFKGPETARLAFPMTTGRRIAETMGSISCISMSPWELVAVYTAHRSGCAGTGTDGRVLRLDGDELGVDPAVVDYVRKVFGHVGLRSDRIDRRHVDVAEGDGFRCRDGYFHSNSFSHLIPPPPAW